MKLLAGKYQSKYKSKSLLNIGKHVSINAVLQITIQILTLIIGILIIRILPQQEYAWYTILNSVLSSLMLMSDAGITIAFISQGGKIWGEHEKTGKLFKSAMIIRRKMAMIFLLITLPFLCFSLAKNGASVFQILLSVLTFLPIFLSTFLTALYDAVLKLDNKPVMLQTIALRSGLIRLALVPILWIFSFSFIAILLNGLANIYGNLTLRRKVSQIVSIDSGRDMIYEKAIWKFIRRSLPDIIFYSFSSQILIWILSLKGQTTFVAELGGLGRVGMAFGVLTILFNLLVTPKFARLKSNQRQLGIYINISAAVVVFCLLILTLSYFLAPTILAVLGPNYQALSFQLMLFLVANCLTICTGTSFSMYSAKGYIIHPIVSIGFGITSLIMGIFLFNLTSLAQALEFNIFIAATQYIFHLVYGFLKLHAQLKEI